MIMRTGTLLTGRATCTAVRSVRNAGLFLGQLFKGTVDPNQIGPPD
jgi:hypothetical protein